MKYSRWDEVILKVDDLFGYTDRIVSHLKVMVIGSDVDCYGDHAQYLCYIPPYERVPGGFQTFKINRFHLRHFDIEPKYLGDDGCFITADDPIHKHIPAARGERCDHCDDFIAGGERNEQGSFHCRACRENPYR